MSRIKEAFDSRFENGVILNTDLSGAEVIALAILTHDPVLIDDINAGRDMHRFFAAALFKIPEEQVTKNQRSLVKKFTFALQYGSGAAGLAAKNGTTVEVAQEFISNYYSRYEKVKEWQDANIKAVKASRTVTEKFSKQGFPIGRGELESVTGRIYAFTEQDSEKWEPSFKPTEIKNYPVQGLATGDMMALLRAKVYRRWIVAPWRSKALPINTVHDSTMWDCADVETAMEVAKVTHEVIDSLAAEMKKLWDIDVPVEIKAESEIGPTWASLKQVEVV